MPDYEFDAAFEARLEQGLQAIANEGLRPFDAVEIAHLAATGRPAAPEPAPKRGFLPAPLMAALLTGLLVVALAATAFAAGWLRLPTPVVEPSPTTSPSPTGQPSPASPLPEPTVTPPVETPTTTPVTSPTPPSETPSPSPDARPTVEPSPPPASPTPAPATLGAWQRLVDFPAGEGFVIVRDVTRGGPGFVAVGFASDGAGLINTGLSWTSTDGSSWTAGDPAGLEGSRPEIVVEHQGSLYAFGPIPTDDEDFPDRGAYNIWRSADGLAWERLPQPAVFAEDATLLGAVSAGEVLVAFGSRNPPGAPSALPGIWTWEAAGGDWQAAQALPQTYDVSRMAYSDGVLLALGNSTTDEPPWRSLWLSTDAGRSWRAASVPPVSDLEDTAAAAGRWVAVGWQARARDDVIPGVAASADGDSWTGGPLDQLAMQQMERVVAIPGGFLALGNEMRFEVDPNCAPGPCEELVGVAGRAWTSTDGLNWAPASEPPEALYWTFGALAASDLGVVVAGNNRDFQQQIWFAPLSPALP